MHLKSNNIKHKFVKVLQLQKTHTNSNGN